MKVILLKVITPNGIIFEGDVTLLTVRTIFGDQGILPNHSPFVSFLGIGVMRIHTKNKDVIKYNVSNGLLVVEKTIIKILTDNVTVV